VGVTDLEAVEVEQRVQLDEREHAESTEQLLRRGPELAATEAHRLGRPGRQPSTSRPGRSTVAPIGSERPELLVQFGGLGMDPPP
jgi:hypothetical protein